MKRITKQIHAFELKGQEHSTLLFDAYYLKEYAFFGQKLSITRVAQAFEKLIKEHNDLVQKHNELVDLFFKETEQRVEK